MEKVYPELRSLCALHGRELQMVDPHWGLKDDVVDDHSIMDVCLSNLQKCTRDHLQAVNMVVSAGGCGKCYFICMFSLLDLLV